MKIVFLCGSLEPGRDGVGDYTRRLAGALIRKSHEIGIVALNDKKIKEVVNEHQADGNVEIPILRIPKVISSKKRYFFAKEWIDIFDPQWLSLQYVPFAFQEKGLPFSLGKHLKDICKARCLDIMFHELWVGIDVEASPKLVLWGRVQRQIIHSMLKKLRPNVIHTQTNLYQALLQKLGYKAEYLPLFSNLPVVKKNRLRYSSPSTKCTNLFFVVFGSIHPGAPVVQFATEVVDYAKKYEVKVKITFIGRGGKELQNWVDILERKDLTIEVLGEQTPQYISEVLSDAMFGISTTPFLLAEKSSVIATMLGHKLPVICVARKWTVRGLENEAIPNIVLAYQKGNFEELLQVDNNFCQSNEIQIIAEKLLSNYTASH